MTRIVNSDAVLTKLLRDPTCRVCGKPAGSGHHLLPRGQGGDDVPENIVPLCGSGTTGCHGKVEARDAEARAAIRFGLHEEELTCLVRKFKEAKGGRAYGEGAALAWLDRNYHPAYADG